MIVVCGSCTIKVVMSDICKEDVDIIVNAANSQLKHGGGVALALDKASNFELSKYSQEKIIQCGNIMPGEIALTKGGGNLLCKYIIHAVGPTATPTSSASLCQDLLNSAVTKALYKAQEMACSSIAFPAISTGIFGVDCDLAADAIINAILSVSTSLKLIDIRIVIIDKPTYSCFAKHLLMKCNSTNNYSGKSSDNIPAEGMCICIIQ